MRGWRMITECVSGGKSFQLEKTHQMRLIDSIRLVTEAPSSYDFFFSMNTWKIYQMPF